MGSVLFFSIAFVIISIYIIFKYLGSAAARAGVQVSDQIIKVCFCFQIR